MNTNIDPNELDWKPTSWRSQKGEQMPVYKDQQALDNTNQKLASYPPLVFAGEIDDLTQQLGRVSRGEAFLLQGGDCAESFAEHSADNIRDFIKIFLQMALTLTYAGGKPIVKVARMAGQFAKPRSSSHETQNDVSLNSYRGDIINGADFTERDREPDPHRMIMSYRQSAATINLMRAFCHGGYASLEATHAWNLDFLEGSKAWQRYRALAKQIDQTLTFISAIGLSSDNTSRLKTADLYTSHEALLLEYEEPMTRIDSLSNNYFDTSAHMVWIGERTRNPDHAHVEFCRGIKNPIGVKIGPTATSDDVRRLCDILNPQNIAGRMTFIVRMGADNVDKYLPKLLADCKGDGHAIVWSCDPMHGNTVKANNGYKTRRFEDIYREVKSFFNAHEGAGTHAGGIHLEMTGQNVTECVGGEISSLTDSDLSDRYHTFCDPRLNAEQALELAFTIAEQLREKR